MKTEEILKKLEDIVGKDFATNRSEDLYIYSQDPGASLPRHVDFVVMPGSSEEVQEIVRLANQEKIPLSPMGGGLTLSGLVIPIKGGIVLDMKRMNKIIEVNELSRFALIEAGVTSGHLLAYLNANYPDLQPPIPDAPPSVTIAGNALIHGSGYLSQKFGDHGAMINGLEVVLPDGELCKLGSCAVSEYWFTRGPIPDFIGMFTSSFGTLGITTKLSIKLFPKPKMRDIVFGLCKDPKILPELISNITSTDVAEDILLGIQDKPDWMKGYTFIIVYITGETEEELSSKTKILKKMYRSAKSRYMKVPERVEEIFLEKPQFAAKAADFRKGGGFEYVGAFIPLQLIPELIQIGTEISLKHGIVPTLGARLIGQGHAIMFFISYSFNRADPDDMKNAREALHETNKAVLEIGGIPWKAEVDGQQLILEKMDPNYKKLLKNIKNLLDPNGIMNPGNWEVK
ncbi:MAG: FAD-binding oxidoreductase [Candidatus Lokiarchaeota archaeon]|nr:FAD-binding oxidoreductase [Candidatus Lokiarchaeota archaeon]